MRYGLRFFLSHHRPEHEHRCVRVLGQPICARCLGMYPPLLVGLLLLFWLEGGGRAPAGPLPFEGIILTVLVIPALLDWIRGRVRPRSGSNLVRLSTGALLGLALARTIHLHAQAPFEKPAVDVIVVLVAGVAAGEIIARAVGPGETAEPRRDKMDSMDPDGASNVEVVEGQVKRPDDRSEHG